MVMLTGTKGNVLPWQHVQASSINVCMLYCMILFKAESSIVRDDAVQVTHNLLILLSSTEL